MHMPEIVIPFGQTESSPVTTMTGTDDPIEKRVVTVGACAQHGDQNRRPRDRRGVSPTWRASSSPGATRS